MDPIISIHLQYFHTSCLGTLFMMRHHSAISTKATKTAFIAVTISYDMGYELWVRSPTQDANDHQESISSLG